MGYADTEYIVREIKSECKELLIMYQLILIGKKLEDLTQILKNNIIENE